jgi:hypothetical protein
MTGSAIVFLVVFWALILGMCIITLKSILKHESKH